MSKNESQAVGAVDFDIPQNAEEEVGAATSQVLIHGRNVEVPDHFARRIESKLARVERLDPTIQRFEVELRHEKNPRRADHCNKIEITVRRKGHLVRGEAGEESFYAALESVCDKLERSLRKVKVRRRISRSGHRTPESLSEISARWAAENAGDKPAEQSVELGDVDTYADSVEDVLPGRIVRRKSHPDTPMTVDEALYQMELVGHDFYLFHDSESDKPCVVYRRRAYDYGVITLGE